MQYSGILVSVNIVAYIVLMQGVGDYLNNTLEERRFLMYRDAEFRGTLFK